MLIEKHKQPDNVATRILSRVRDYGQANEKGKVFDRIFNKGDVLREITASKNVVGQGVQQMMFPNGMAPDGYSTFAPALGLYDGALDSTRVQDAIAENQVQLYWRKNVERCLKYNTVAGRSEVNESLIQICNEAIYKDDLDEICSLSIDSDAEIGESTQKMLHTIFRKEVLRRILNFDKDGWHYMKKLLIEGRLFFEVLYDEKSKSIVGVNMLPSQNIIVIVQDNLIIGYRQMLDGAYNQSVKTGGKNYIDFSPNQILFVDLNIYGPGGVNDPRSIIEPAMKPFNQLNTIEDSVVMYRVLWGSEKLVLKVDTSGMPKQLAEKHMKDQAKVFSRKIDYNTLTGEITNFGRAIGLSEHYIIPVSQEREHSQIERLAGGDQLGNIDDLKFFKRNLINSLMVPPGRITSLVGEKDNFSNGKIGEVTQGEVSFARLIGRYQTPIEIMIVRLFVMVLNTKQVINDDIKVQENFKVRFKRSNGFQNFIDAEVWTSRLTVFESMMKHTSTKDNPNGALAKQFALHYGLRITDDEYSKNKEWIKKEKAEDLGET
jgi:hypothetical protein